MIYLLREGLDYDRFITEGDIPDSPDNSKIDNVNQLVISANKYNDIVVIELHGIHLRMKGAMILNGVSLMTIHKSKGLEFPVVFVVGMVEGVLPHKNGDIEEERRIAFVGISRAMQLLYMSYALKYMGKRTKNRTS
jgi:DNA helicase-2/ATP-dependent DNA helicase PcrA